MKKHEKTIEVDVEDLDIIEDMFLWGKDEILAHNLPLCSTIRTWTARFDKYDIDIKLNTSEDDCWSEAVLFDKGGRQVAFCEPSYQIEGAWSFEVDGEEYTAVIKGVY